MSSESLVKGVAEKIFYIPPDFYLIIQFARDVCQSMATAGDPAFTRTEVVDGFVGFLNAVAQATAHQLNHHEGEFLDNHQSQG